MNHTSGEGAKVAMMLWPGVPVAILFALCFGWQCRCHLELHASWFRHILTNTGRTNKAYRGHAGEQLSLLSGKRRGMILEDFCTKKLAQMHPHSTIEEPAPGTCCNGARRSARNAPYDFTLDGRKIECKSSRLFGTTARCVGASDFATSCCHG